MKKEDKELQYEMIKYLYELLGNPYIQAMKFFTHHERWTVLDHVRHCTKWVIRHACKTKKNLDYKSLIRGCLLHDFYLYNWRDNEPYHYPHLIKHPQIAYENAVKVFGDINDIEKDIITHHMWPTGGFGNLPKYKESWYVIRADKACGFREPFAFFLRKRKTGIDFQTQAFNKYWSSINGPKLR